MEASIRPVASDERDALIAFIAADTYPYNNVPQPTPVQVASWLDKGLYAESFWIMRGDGTRIGVMYYDDASVVHGELHIRLHRPSRIVGTQAIAWLTDYLFTDIPGEAPSKGGHG